jgi:hypothetical protein
MVKYKNIINLSSRVSTGNDECQMPKFARSDEPKVNQAQMKSKCQISKPKCRFALTFGIWALTFVIDLEFEF